MQLFARIVWKWSLHVIVLFCRSFVSLSFEKSWMFLFVLFHFSWCLQCINQSQRMCQCCQRMPSLIALFYRLTQCLASKLTFLNCYMSTLHPVHYALLQTPTSWKSSNTNARVMAFVLSLALDPTFGVQTHKTLDTAQPCHLLKPNWKPHSISTPTNINTQFLLQSLCVCACVCVCVCVCVFIYYNTLCKLLIIIDNFCIVLFSGIVVVELCSMCVQNSVFRLTCIMWALGALMSAR